MAPYIPVENVLQANLRFTVDGQQCENVLNFEYPRSEFSTSASQIGNNIETVLWAQLRAFIAAGCEFREVYMVDLTSQDGPVQTYDITINPNGAVLTEAVPNNVTFCVTHRTQSRGRSFRGRSYVVGIAEGLVLNSSIGPVGVAGIVGAFEALRVACQTDGLPLVVVSRFANGAPRLAGVATPVTECVSVDNVVDSQRRRLPGRGS